MQALLEACSASLNTMRHKGPSAALLHAADGPYTVMSAGASRDSHRNKKETIAFNAVESGQKVLLNTFCCICCNRMEQICPIQAVSAKSNVGSAIAGRNRPLFASSDCTKYTRILPSQAEHPTRLSLAWLFTSWPHQPSSRKVALNFCSSSPKECPSSSDQPFSSCSIISCRTCRFSSRLAWPVSVICSE